MPRGGENLGAGKPREGKYGKESRLIYRPYSRAEASFFLKKERVPQIPFYLSSVCAGFPSPADGEIEKYLDLNELLIAHPASTFFVKASGDSMTEVGIQSGDILIVDRSLEATHGKVIIAAINGELTVKKLSRLNGRVRLLPENNGYPPIDITEEQDLVIWGVVKHVIHSFS